MKKKYIITLLTAIVMILLMQFGYFTLVEDDSRDQVKVGFLYVGDSCNMYTQNFIHAQEQMEMAMGDRVETIAKYNVAEGMEKPYIQELVDEGCDLIMGTSYGYQEQMKLFAQRYPDVEFCMATGDNADDAPILSNYHTAMGAVYQGRYIAGVVAGMKLQEMIDQGIITPKQAKIGYVGAFPYAEVISGYTAFFLGVRSIVPTATMSVRYTASWGDYELERQYARQFIDEGCVIISQHSDTAGPAVACEESIENHTVYHVGYNWSMTDVAPTTSLIGCRINWTPYLTGAVEAVLRQEPIESCVDARCFGTDASAGFDKNWVQMLKLNDIIAAEHTQEKIDELIKGFANHEIEVFQGDYTGVDPFDETDVYDLNDGFTENESQSAPSFHYVLKDVITVRNEEE